jgi:hypothetical protein
LTRSQLATLLADLVRRKVITQDEAAQVLASFDADELDALAPVVSDDDGGDWLAALALLLLLIGGSARRRIPVTRRRRAQTLLRGRFDATTRQLAQNVAGGALPVAAWHAGLQAALASYTRQMAIAGAGQLPSVATRAAIDARLGEQWPLMERFAVTVAARLEVDRPLSPAYIANRARQYGGTGWGAFFLAQGQGAAAGMVEQWISRDDRNTCRICAPRHLQYFLPAQGPMPGTDCLGGGLCRCQRVQVFAPDIYAELTGQPTRRAA